MPSGVWPGWVSGCELAIAHPHVAIFGPSRERVIDQAARLIRVACHNLPSASISAHMQSPPPVSGHDAWTIIVNADIAFCPTALGAVFPEISDGRKAHLV